MCNLEGRIDADTGIKAPAIAGLPDQRYMKIYIGGAGYNPNGSMPLFSEQLIQNHRLLYERRTRNQQNKTYQTQVAAMPASYN